MLRIDIARHLKSSLYGQGIMDSELLLKFFGYLPDYISALSHTLLRIFGQPLSKQLYTQVKKFAFHSFIRSSNVRIFIYSLSNQTSRGGLDTPKISGTGAVLFLGTLCLHV